MFSYLAKRILYAIPTLIGVSILVFAMIHLTPGDPARNLLGERASEEAVIEIRKKLGLDKPKWQQYTIFMTNAIQGDFGQSTQSREQVMVEFKDRFPATLELTLVSMFFAVFFGIIAGIVAAVRRYSIFDYASMVGALGGVSMPVFWLGLVLIYIFSVQLGILPVSGRLSYEYYIQSVTGLYLVDSLIAGDIGAFGSALHHLILPGIALATIPMAIIARMTRSSMLEVMQEDYIKTAKAKGCSPWRVIMVHSLRNALIPVITVTGLMLGTLLGGAVLTETVFSWPGIGKWIVNAVTQKDYPVIQCATLIIATIFIFVNLLSRPYLRLAQPGDST